MTIAVFQPLFLLLSCLSKEGYVFLTHINIAFAHEKNETCQVLGCLHKYPGVNVEEQTTAWKLRGFGYQSTSITDTCNFMNYTTSPFHRRDGADPEEGWLGHHAGSCHAPHSPATGSWALFRSLGSPRLERCSQILVKVCGASVLSFRTGQRTP